MRFGEICTVFLSSSYGSGKVPLLALLWDMCTFPPGSPSAFLGFRGSFEEQG